MCGKQNQVEPIVDLVNAIFHGDSRHRLSLRKSNGCVCVVERYV
jgi:hypothetical protein